MKTAIIEALPPEYPWKDRFHYLPSTDSTNDRLKAMAREGAPHGSVVIAGHQSAGHGRRGRSFESPAGMGVYLSMLLRPDCEIGQLMHLTCAAGLAMCDAVERISGIRPGIKWTNDLVVGKRKLGGILTELGFAPGGKLDYAIVGIGINCGQGTADFPDSIRSIATSLAVETGRKISAAAVAAAMMTALWEMDRLLMSGRENILRRYKENCITLGKDISIVSSDTIDYGRAVDIDESGALVVRFADGQIRTVNAGEVSIRGMYGYV